VRAVLISTYDMGRQPFGLASPAAWLREAGVEVRCADVGKERLPEEAVREADLVAFFLPMHTATRLALPVIERVRALNPGARLAAYGLYAPLNAALLRERGVADVLGAEFEEDLVRLARSETVAPSGGTIPRLAFRTPDRAGLPPLSRYATLETAGGPRIAGYTEASRGCKHFCRHCPVVPVYEGRFRIVPPEVVIADARAQVAAGARHITFGDPDFLNGPRHAVAVIERLARECPGVSYDVTIKIEHLLKHADLLPLLRDTGCAFVTSAVESVDDAVLARLAKGHTRADFERVVELCAQAGVPLVPTFVAFTPWTTLETYCDLLQAIDRLGLVDHVAPIQLAIRLLVPEGSRLLEFQEVRALTRGFDAASLTYRWVHPDPRVDALQARLAALAGARIDAGREEVFGCAWVAAHETAGIDAVRRPPPLVRATIPYLNEPWYC
jgi:radical SAM superfamily enzyme YgiQ (UPF0313 family)